MTIARAWLAANKDMLGLSGADDRRAAAAPRPRAARHRHPRRRLHADLRRRRRRPWWVARRRGRARTARCSATPARPIRAGDLVGSRSAAPRRRRCRGSPRAGSRASRLHPDKTGTEGRATTCSPAARSPPRRTSRRSPSRPPTAPARRTPCCSSRSSTPAGRSSSTPQTGKQLYKPQPGAARAPAARSTTTTPAPRRAAQPRHVSFDPTPESPNGYVDPTGLAGTGVTTFGNNANAHANWSNFIAPVDPGPRPVSPTGQFDYVFADNWGTSEVRPDVLPAGPGAGQHQPLLPAQPDPRPVLQARASPRSAGNFQVDNFGKGGNAATPSRDSSRPAPSPAATRPTPAATTPTC